MKTVLLVTDFYYQAKGRQYYQEDVALSGYLRKHFKVLVGHIADVAHVVPYVDAVLLRNTGPQMLHQEHLTRLKGNKHVYNDLSGKGDICGKYHLLELYKAGYPVIPSFSSKKEAGECEEYLVKPLNGADSCGVQRVSLCDLQDCYSHALIQPLVDFAYEVSFYFVDTRFYYALYAPTPDKRWELECYPASAEDVAFAKQFVDWNSCRYGVQRVDACRLHDGRLLLMELEDYNPFLSIDVLTQEVKEQFLEGLCASLANLINLAV